MACKKSVSTGKEMPVYEFFRETVVGWLKKYSNGSFLYFILCFLSTKLTIFMDPPVL